MDIAIIGGGLTGSLLTDVLIAHLVSNDRNPEIVVIDHDKVEHRNSPGNLHPLFKNLGQHKADILAGRFVASGISSRPIKQRVTQKNYSAILGKAGLIVGAVDNIEARDLMWLAANSLSIPYVDVGIGPVSFSVGWVADDIDSTQFNPLLRLGRKPDTREKAKDPPCTLVGTRMMAAIATEGLAKSIMVFLYGQDPSQLIPALVDRDAMPGDVISWIGGGTAFDLQAKATYSGRIDV